MAEYYANKKAQDNGDHEVHEGDCNYLPGPGNKLYLGFFTNCYDAVKEAKKYFPQSNGCYYCSQECHTS